jgi:hypothetical protein
MHLQAKNTLKSNFEKQFSIWLKIKKNKCVRLTHLRVIGVHAF